MKIVQVVSFMHVVVGKTSRTTTIHASRVNKFCTKMYNLDIACALEMRDFRALASIYPYDINITPTEVIVEPTPRLKKALLDASRFDINRPDDNEICKVWKSVKR